MASDDPGTVHNYLLELDLPLLKAGQIVILPDIAAQPARAVVRLWD